MNSRKVPILALAAVVSIATPGLHAAAVDVTKLQPQLLADLQTGTESSSPELFTLAGGKLYLVASDPSEGGGQNELWVYDGSGVPTRLLDSTKYLDYPAPCANRLFFSAEQAGQREPWISDGTISGTVPLDDLGPEAVSSDPEYSAAVTGGAVFTATDADGLQKLFTTDCNGAATTQVSNAVEAEQPLDPSSLTSFKGKAYFIAADETLWVSDGTDAGTESLGVQNPGVVVATSDALYVSIYDADAESYEIFRTTDGSAASLAQVTTSDIGELRRTVASTDGAAYFFAKDTAGVNFIVRVNPTGPALVLAGASGHDSSLYPAANGRAVFGGFVDGTYGNYITDGTAAGTVRVGDGVDIPLGALPIPDTVYTAVFLVDEADLHPEIWVTDGTAAGTHLVAELDEPITPDLRATAILGTKLIFAWKDATHGQEPFYIDLTHLQPATETQQQSGGAVPLAALALLMAAAMLRNRALRGALLGTLVVGQAHALDVTQFQPQLVADLEQDMAAENSNPRSFTVAGDKVFFLADESSTNARSQVWVYSGSGAPTTVLSSADEVSQLAKCGDKLFFKAYASGQAEAWLSDGTTAGTEMIDLAGPLTSDPDNVVSTGNSVAFVAQNAEESRTLGRSNCTAAGTELMYLVSDGPTSPTVGAAMNGKGYFVAGGGRPNEIWEVDSQEPDNTPVISIGDDFEIGAIASTGNSIVFAAYNESPSNRWTIFRTTGGTPVVILDNLFGIEAMFASSNGTVFALVSNENDNWDIVRIAADGSTTAFAPSGNEISGFLGASPAADGKALIRAIIPGKGGERTFISDGSKAGTTAIFGASEAIASALPIPDSRYTVVLTDANETSNRTLWVTDGTVAGTHSVATTTPYQTNDDSLAIFNNKVLLSWDKNDGKGAELYSVDLAGLPTEESSAAESGGALGSSALALLTLGIAFRRRRDCRA